jgi:hypothetical protein
MRELPGKDTIGDNPQSETGSAFAGTPGGSAAATFEIMVAGIVRVSTHGHAEREYPTYPTSDYGA